MLTLILTLQKNQKNKTATNNVGFFKMGDDGIITGFFNSTSSSLRNSILLLIINFNICNNVGFQCPAEEILIPPTTKPFALYESLACESWINLYFRSFLSRLELLLKANYVKKNLDLKFQNSL